MFEMGLYLFCLALVLAELPEEKEFYKLLGLCLTVSIPLPLLTKLLRILDRVWSNEQAAGSLFLQHSQNALQNLQRQINTARPTNQRISSSTPLPPIMQGEKKKNLHLLRQEGKRR